MVKQKVARRRVSMQLRTTDSKGRVSLGTSFANAPVSIEAKSSGEWVVRLVEPVPVNEAWLLKNQEALNLVSQGIIEASEEVFVKDPRAGKSYSWLEDVEEEVDGDEHTSTQVGT